MRFSPTSSKDHFMSLILTATTKGVLSSAQPAKQIVFNIKNLSHIKILNKGGTEIGPCGKPVKCLSKNYKISLLQLLAYGLINNPEVNSRKIYQCHKHAVNQLRNNDKNNQTILRVCQQCSTCITFVSGNFSKTQISLISSFECPFRKAY